MKILKSIISAFLSIAIVSMTATPAFAVDPGLIVDGAAVIPSFFDRVVGSLQSFGYWESSFFDKDICSSSGPTGNGRHVFEPQYTTINGKLGNYYICKNCGKSAGEVSEPAYQEQVSELPAQGYTSDGGLIIPLEVACHKAVTDYSSSWNQPNWLYCDNHTLSSKKYSSFTIHFSCESNSVSYSLNSGYSDFVNPGLEYYVSFTAPYDGYYSFLCPPVSISYVTSSGERGSRVGSGSLDFSSPVYYEAGYNLKEFSYRYLCLCLFSPAFLFQEFRDLLWR